MNWIDLIIIYLAAGAPFAVHDYLSRERKFRSVLRSAANGLIWLFKIPSLLQVIVKSRLTESPVRTSGDHGFTREIESRLAAGSDAHEVFLIREILGRYEGLSGALRDSEGETPDAQFFEVADHPDPELAAHILGRRVRGELQERRESAARELIDLFGHQDGNGTGKDLPVKALTRLFHRFGDGQAIERLQAVIGESARSTAYSEQEGGTLWKGRLATQNVTQSNGMAFTDLTRKHSRPARDWKD